jgi:hypothetical protein
MVGLVQFLYPKISSYGSPTYPTHNQHFMHTHLPEFQTNSTVKNRNKLQAFLCGFCAPIVIPVILFKIVNLIPGVDIRFLWSDIGYRFFVLCAWIPMVFGWWVWYSKNFREVASYFLDTQILLMR